MCDVSMPEWRIENRGGREDTDAGLLFGGGWKETAGSTGWRRVHTLIKKGCESTY